VQIWCFVFGAGWLCIPLYRVYCQSTGQGLAGEDVTGHKDYSEVMGSSRAEEAKKKNR
jgi:cytochrome c oxidase assembly protein Cox11